MESIPHFCQNSLKIVSQYTKYRLEKTQVFFLSEGLGNESKNMELIIWGLMVIIQLSTLLESQQQNKGLFGGGGGIQGLTLKKPFKHDCGLKIQGVNGAATRKNYEKSPNHWIWKITAFLVQFVEGMRRGSLTQLMLKCLTISMFAF